MTTKIDGTYSMVASSVAGGSMLVLSFVDGVLEGNDIAGSRYTGTVTDLGDGTVRIDFKAEMPPNTFAIWGTSLSETWMTREGSAVLPIDDILESRPIRVEELAMWVVFQRRPDEIALQAGSDGYQLFADMVAALAAVRARK